MIRAQVLICGGTGCTSSGSNKLIAEFESQIEKNGLIDEVKVVRTGCFGLCALGPVVIVYPDGTFYSQVEEKDVKDIVEEHLLKGRIVERLVYNEVAEGTVIEHGMFLLMILFSMQSRRELLFVTAVLLTPKALMNTLQWTDMLHSVSVLLK